MVIVYTNDRPFTFGSAKDYTIDENRLLNIRARDGHLIATYAKWDSVAIITEETVLKAI